MSRDGKNGRERAMCEMWSREGIAVQENWMSEGERQRLKETRTTIDMSVINQSFSVSRQTQSIQTNFE